MKKKHISFILILLILLMIVIFYLSAQPAEESTVTSSQFCEITAKLLFRNFVSYESGIQETILEGLVHIVRKTAHFTEYAVMGFLWYLLLRKKHNNIILSIGATAFYAASDELHQRFVAGRSGQISDVLLDACGGCFGVMAGFILLCIIYCCADRNILNWGTWKK
ncbi:MAG: VanZ family protein [Oscillospiraceae bacterium]|nr:VanZ family protein [Oscillospiraceae bacterium]